MPEDAISHLRIYCICGQKMKMAEAMFGRHGKCVACRQKIRVPRRDEIPEGVDTIYLKDHPEFLRRGARRGRGAKGASRPIGGAVEAEGEAPVAVAETPQEDAVLGSEKDRVSTAPLDVLEPLRSVCSVQYSLHRQLRTLDKYSRQDSSKRSEVKRQLKHVSQVRADMDEKLRQVLMEVAIELATTQEKIVQTGLSARVGEIGFDEYRETIDRLRRRRDRLERRQQNLRGWLATSDPHLAGGYVDVSLDSLPEDGFLISLPMELDDPEPLLSQHLGALREGLRRRGEAERKLAEIKRMRMEDDVSEGYGASRADQKAERKLADALVTHARGRLEQLAKDYEKDMQTVDSQLGLVRGRLQTGEITRAQFDEEEGILVRAKTDAAKARAVINRGLLSNSAQDVPQARGTFLGRLAARRGEIEIGVDAWIAWGAAVFLGIGIFLPSMGPHSLVGSFIEFTYMDSAIRWAFLGPLLVGVAVAFAAGLPERITRGRILLGVWLVGLIAGAIAIQHAQYGMDAMSTRFRGEPPWYLRPGLFMLLCGHMGVLVAAFMALWVEERERLVAMGAAVVGVAALLGVLTDLGGMLTPTPGIGVSTGVSAREFDLGGMEERIITIRNDGYRRLHVVPRVSESRGAYLLRVERRIGQASWADTNVLGDSAEGILPRGGPDDLPDRVLFSLGRGESAQLPVYLEVGEYRVVLASTAFGRDVTLHFRIDGPPVEAGPEADLPPPPPPRTGRPGGAEVVLPEDESSVEVEEPGLGEPSLPPARDSGVEIRLSGIITPENGDPRFPFTIFGPGAVEQRALLSIGDAVHGDWIVAEYNPQLGTVTLTTEGGELLVLRRGERIRLY